MLVVVDGVHLSEDCLGLGNTLHGQQVARTGAQEGEETGHQEGEGTSQREHGAPREELESGVHSRLPHDGRHHHRVQSCSSNSYVTLGLSSANLHINCYNLMIFLLCILDF